MATATADGPEHRLMHIGGAWVDAVDGGRLEAVDPTSERVVATFPDGGEQDVDRAVASADEAVENWRDLGWARRGAILRELADRITESADALARLDVVDSGNPLTGMRRDIAGASAEILYYAGLSPEIRGSTSPPSPDTLSYTLREPYGVVARIVPFNHPFKFAAGKVAAPLAAGNAVVLKPSEHTSLSALELARISEGLLPPGVAECGDGAREHSRGGAGGPSGRSANRLHRLGAHRPCDHALSRGAHQARQPRARWQEPDRRLPRRRPGAGGAGGSCRDEHRPLHRAVLRFDLAPLRA